MYSFLGVPSLHSLSARSRSQRKIYFLVFCILIINKKVLVLCEKLLDIFIKSLRFETPGVRKTDFRQRMHLHMLCRTQNSPVSLPDNDPGSALELVQGHCLLAVRRHVAKAKVAVASINLHLQVYPAVDPPGFDMGRLE